MTTTLKEVSAIFGHDIADDKDFDLTKFKAHVDGKYITRDAAIDDDELVGKITGKRLGTIQTKLAQTFGLKAAEMKDKKVEDLIELVGNASAKTIERLQKEATEGVDKRIGDLQKQLEEKDKSVNDYKKLAEDTKTEFDGFKTTKDGEIKSYKVNHKLNEVKSKIPFIDDFDKNEVVKKGFSATIAEKYQFDLDDKDELVVKDTKGHRIKHPTKTGEWADAETVFTTEAEANKLLKKNNAKPGIFPVRKEPVDNGGGGNTTGRKANNKAIMNAER